MNYIQIAKESIRIAKERKYDFQGQEVTLPNGDLENVIVISPQMGERMLEEDLSPYYRDASCEFLVWNADSFQAARKLNAPLVMNFANAHVAGGVSSWRHRAGGGTLQVQYFVCFHPFEACFGNVSI